MKDCIRYGILTALWSAITFMSYKNYSVSVITVVDFICAICWLMCFIESLRRPNE